MPGTAGCMFVYGLCSEDTDLAEQLEKTRSVAQSAIKNDGSCSGLSAAAGMKGRRWAE